MGVRRATGAASRVNCCLTLTHAIARHHHISCSSFSHASWPSPQLSMVPCPKKKILILHFNCWLKHAINTSHGTRQGNAMPDNPYHVLSHNCSRTLRDVNFSRDITCPKWWYFPYPEWTIYCTCISIVVIKQVLQLHEGMICDARICSYKKIEYEHNVDFLKKFPINELFFLFKFELILNMLRSLNAKIDNLAGVLQTSVWTKDKCLEGPMNAYHRKYGDSNLKWYKEQQDSTRRNDTKSKKSLSGEPDAPATTIVAYPQHLQQQ